MKKLGYISVDTGQIIVLDPVNLDNKNITYDKACSKDIKNNLAVVSGTGMGDGVYPVYAVIEDTGKFGKRVSKIIIDFELKKGIKLMERILIRQAKEENQNGRIRKSNRL